MESLQYSGGFLLSKVVSYFFYYIDTDEIPGFFLLLKIISSSRAVKILFLSFTCEDIGLAIVTNINFDFLEQKI